MSEQIYQDQAQYEQNQGQQVEIDPAYQEVVQEIVQDNIQTYGRKNKPRYEEPSMSQLLSWQPKEGEQWSYKTNNPQVLHQQGYQKYKARIARTDDNYTSEIQDQYRRYHYDKNSGAVVPEFDLEQLELMRQEKERQQQDEQLQSKGVILADDAQQQVQCQQQENMNLDSVQNQLQTNAQKQGKKQFVKKQTAGVFYYKDADQIAAEKEAELKKQEQEEQMLEDAQKLQEQQDSQYHRPIPNTDLTKVKSKLLSYKKTAKKLDPVYEKERLDRRKERITHMKGTTRELPNSAFTTYFGKPAWENYGRGNVQPAVGGMIYGQYLLSHNVNPHKGNKQPKFIQSHKNALDYGERLPVSEPQPPRNCKEEFRLSQKQVEELKTRNPLTSTLNKRENLKIVKPDLVNSLRFASEENSPERAESEETRRKKLLEQNKTFKRVPKTGTKNQSGASQALSTTSQQKNVQIREPNDASSVQKSDKQSVKSQQQKKGQQQQQQQKQKQQQQKQVKENLDEYERRHFMQELKQKKEQSNRLALKVTEVVPVANQRPQSAQVQQTRPQAQVTTAQDFNEMNPPQGYLQEIEEYELNPKNYKNIPPQWMKRIPFAGKKLQSDQPFTVYNQ